jgi:RsiW-degrading membrane proteinase PrsW (M82 family)
MSDRQAFYKKLKWLWVFIVGILLFIATEQALKYTGNPNFFPTLLLLGSFVIPVTFVTYIYERERRLDTHTGSPLVAATLCFLVGGAIGVVAAGVLEFETLKSLSALGLLGVGVIEEAAKLIFPVGLFLWGRYRSEMDGILFGVAAGMGFASLETMGYGLVSFVRAGGDINILEQVLLVRGIISPVGHAAWTGLVCAVMWRERQRGKQGRFVLAAFIVFIVAVILHALWDLSNSLASSTTASMVFTLLGNLAVAAASLTLLIRRLREARRYSGEAVSK